MDRHDKQFIENTIELREWWDLHGGMWPSRTSSDRDERRLATWLGNQRLLATGARAGRWSDERERFLNENLPGWAEDSLAPNLETEFAVKLDELCQWTAANKRWPQSGSADKAERRMWNRLNNFRRSEMGSLPGRWNEQRRQLLDTRLPGWRGRTQSIHGDFD